MNRPSTSKILPVLLGALLTSAAPASLAVAQTVGTVTAVNQTAHGTPPGGGARVLTLGQDVVFQETIRTNAAGSTQVAFTDRSTLNVGRNSTVIIDQFVFDPGGGNNSMSLTLTKGVLRFVGGQISHTEGATIKTGVATIGVRGGSATVGSGGGGCAGLLIVNNVGTLTLKNNVDTLRITEPGYGVCVTDPNEPFPPPFLVPDELLQAYMDNADSGDGQHGGVNDLPLDDLADRFGLEFPTLEPDGNPFDFMTIINGGNGAANGQSQDNQTGVPEDPGEYCPYESCV